MGRRPAEFHEKLPPEVGQTIVFCRLSSSAAMAARCFFGPVAFHRTAMGLDERVEEPTRAL